MEYVLVPRSDLTQEHAEKIKTDEIDTYMNAQVQMMNACMPENFFQNGLAAIAERRAFLPGDQKLSDEGDWIMVTTPPPTEYTVPPMSFWFALPWLMEGHGGHPMHRVKIITPRGNLGLFPHEYSKVTDVSRYYEFFGNGIEPIFFGAGEGGVPSDALHYLRSRGISKAEAIKMLIGSIKSPDVLYLMTDKSITDTFGMEWPHESRLATLTQIAA